MLDLEWVQRTDTGRVRRENEDVIECAAPRSVAEVQSHGWLFVLADGVGGHDAGEVAARTAVDSVVSGFRASSGPEPHTALLSRLVQAANSDVYETGHAAGKAMATTIVACALRFASAVVAHVGDSRCLLIRRGAATALTQDHTLVQQQVRTRLLSAAEARASENRHILTRSLGADLFVHVDTHLVELQADDVLVLSSDGLHDALDPAEIMRAVSIAASLDAAADELIKLANQADGTDNLSVQLVRVRAVERMGMYRGRPYKLP